MENVPGAEQANLLLRSVFGYTKVRLSESLNQTALCIKNSGVKHNHRHTDGERLGAFVIRAIHRILWSRVSKACGEREQGEDGGPSSHGSHSVAAPFHYTVTTTILGRD